MRKHPPEPIRIVAALVLDGAGRMLVVRKAGTDAFMQPGGKPDAGEDQLVGCLPRRERRHRGGCSAAAGRGRPRDGAGLAKNMGRLVGSVTHRCRAP